eukprot:1285533-Prymnesium_polylepis.1
MHRLRHRASARGTSRRLRCRPYASRGRTPARSLSREPSIALAVSMMPTWSAFTSKRRSSRPSARRDRHEPRQAAPPRRAPIAKRRGRPEARPKTSCSGPAQAVARAGERAAF